MAHTALIAAVTIPIQPATRTGAEPGPLRGRRAGVEGFNCRASLRGRIGAHKGHARSHPPPLSRYRSGNMDHPLRRHPRRQHRPACGRAGRQGPMGLEHRLLITAIPPIAASHTGKRNNSLYWRWLVNLVLPKYRIFTRTVAVWDLLSPYDVLIVLSHCVTHQTGVGWGRDR